MCKDVEESMLGLDNNDSIWLEVSAKQEWCEIRLAGAQIHTLACIVKAFGQEPLRLLYNEFFCFGS